MANLSELKLNILVLDDKEVETIFALLSEVAGDSVVYKLLSDLEGSVDESKLPKVKYKYDDCNLDHIRIER